MQRVQLRRAAAIITAMLIRSTFSNGVVVYQSPRLLDLGVKHAFSTRIGGVSPVPFNSLNFGNPAEGERQDSAGNMAENYRRLLAGINLPTGQRAWVRQVHGCAVAVLQGPADAQQSKRDRAAAGEVPPEFQGALAADAIVGSQPNVALTMRTADCVPILLAAGRGRVVAAIHAGWRGIVADVVGHTIRQLGAMGIEPTEMIAAIGPAIGRDFFEVRGDVTAELRRVGLAAAIMHNPGGQDRVDLNLAVRRQLGHGGVLQVDFGDHCTYRDEGEFFSHRRDHGRTGRMAAVIAAACP